MEIPKHIIEKIERLYGNHFLGDEEIKSLEKWLSKINSNQEVESWLMNNWSLATNIDADISYQEIQRRIALHNKKTRVSKIKQLVSIGQRIAAILVIPLLILSIWLFTNQHNEGSNMVLATAKGEHTHVLLPDGSEVWLNVNTKLEYSTSYNANNRLLKLNGEAFFKVAKDKRHPFIVEMTDYQVKAVGTAFNISAYEGDHVSYVYMQEGVVELSNKNKGSEVYTLKLGDLANLTEDVTDISIEKSISNDYISWMDGKLSFKDDPVAHVFRAIERWYDVKIIFNESDFIDQTFTLKLKKGEPIEKLLDIMKQAVGINITRKGDTYVISKK